jgi:hypothetical protein
LVTHIFASEEETRCADLIDEAYELVKPTEVAVVSDQHSTLRTEIVNPFFKLMDIKIHLDDVLLWEKTNVSVSVDERASESVQIRSGTKNLKVELKTRKAEISFVGLVSLKPDFNVLLIQFWDGEYPPKIVLNGKLINKSIGPEYKLVGELPGEFKQVSRYGLYVRDDDEVKSEIFDYIEDGLVSEYNLVEIWIDDRKVDPLNFDPGDMDGPIRHQAELTPGKYRVKVGSPVLHMVLFEGDIIFNGIDTNELTVYTCKKLSDPCEITLDKNDEVFFKGSHKDLGHAIKFIPKNVNASEDSEIITGGT